MTQKGWSWLFVHAEQLSKRGGAGVGAIEPNFTEQISEKAGIARLEKKGGVDVPSIDTNANFVCSYANIYPVSNSKIMLNSIVFGETTEFALS